MPPALIVLEHATEKPAEDCALASALVERLADGSQGMVCLHRLRDRGAAFPQGGNAEHVLAEGRLADNSLFWVERATSSQVRFCEADDLPDVGSGALVVAFNPIIAPSLTASKIRDRFDALGCRPLWLRAVSDEKGLAVRALDECTDGEDVAHAECDAYARWSLRDEGLSALLTDRFGLAPPSAEARQTSTGRRAHLAVRIAVVGESAHLHDVFPAVLAALGDAADDGDVAVEADLVSPKGLSGADWSSCLAAADGLVLPGGSDLSQVEGQIQAASVAMAGGLPTLGLCLGMQSMTVAAARTAAGLSGATLEEVDPDGSCLLFQRLKNGQGLALHRLGEAPLRVAPATRLAECCGEGPLRERLNHRYGLVEDFASLLEAAGLRICARTDDGSVVEGVEMSDHPFFVGLQSHPELSSRAGAPHPVFRAFLRTAAQHRSNKAPA
jgi:CTP synthase